MMKPLFLSSIVSAVVMTAISCAAPRPGPMAGPTSMDPDLIRAQRRVWETWFAGDTAAFRQMTPGLVSISQGNGISDQDQEIQSAARFHAGGGRLLDLHFTEVRLQRFGDVAIVYSRYHFAAVLGTDTTRQSGYATEVFVRRHGTWVNPGWHLDGGNQNAD